MGHCRVLVCKVYATILRLEAYSGLHVLTFARYPLLRAGKGGGLAALRERAHNHKLFMQAVGAEPQTHRPEL